jgi:hypothetical protein
MTVNPNTGLPIGFILDPKPPTPSTGTSDNNVAPSPVMLRESSSSISPTASFLSQLDQIQQQSPAQYSNIATSMATQLQADATAAQNSGNTAQAKTLTQLATEFQNSAQSGQVPSAQVLQKTLAGHHGHRAEAAGSTESLVATAFANATSSTT